MSHGWKLPEQLNLDTGETRTLREAVGVIDGNIMTVYIPDEPKKETPIMTPQEEPGE